MFNGQYDFSNQPRIYQQIQFWYTSGILVLGYIKLVIAFPFILLTYFYITNNIIISLVLITLNAT